MALRGERFDDWDGARTGTVQRLEGITLTPSYAISGHAIVRGDLRLDTSDKDIFQKRREMIRRQPTVSVNFLYIY